MALRGSVEPGTSLAHEERTDAPDGEQTPPAIHAVLRTESDPLMTPPTMQRDAPLMMASPASLASDARPAQGNPGLQHWSSQGIKSRIRSTQPRRPATVPYLRQLFRTASPFVLTDLLVLLTSVTICSLLGFGWLNPDDPTSLATVWIPPIAVTWILLNAVLGLYPGIGLGTVSDFKRQTMSLTIVAVVTAARIHPASTWAVMRYGFLITAYCICLGLAPVARNLLRKYLSNKDWWGFPTLVCGNNAIAFSVFEWLQNNRRLGLRPLGVICDSDALELEQDAPWYAGNWEEASDIALRERVYWAVVVDSGGEEVIDHVETHLAAIPNALVVSDLTGMPSHWNRHCLDEDLNGFLIEQHLLLPIQQLVKRCMDLAIAIILGILLAPLFLILGTAIKLTSRGPIFYGHERVGFDNSRFRAWKFRTMVDNAEELIEDYLKQHPELRAEWEETHKLKNDPRVTRLGWFMRKWSIDELPQLWNVFVGEMSAVGPRPIVPNEIEKYGTHFEVFCSVLPGMTGLWQVSGRNETTFEERIQLGMYYIHHWSPWLDLYLLARTVKTVLLTKGAY